MSKRTDTDVIVTEYRAVFRAVPFDRPRWTIRGGMECRTTLHRRRRHTVVREYDGVSVDEPARRIPDTGVGHVHESVLLDVDARVLFIPDTPGSRYGHAVIVEQVTRRS